MKKKFKDTKGGKILKSVLNGAMDVLPLPDLRTYVDKNEDGKINWEDVKHFKGVDYFKLAGGVTLLAVMIKFDIVNFEEVAELIKLFLGNA